MAVPEGICQAFLHDAVENKIQLITEGCLKISALNLDFYARGALENLLDLLNGTHPHFPLAIRLAQEVQGPACFDQALLGL